MRLMKFKKGDKVVLFKESHTYATTQVGWHGIFIEYWEVGSQYCDVRWDDFEADPLSVKFEDLMSADLYYSPLMRALS